MPSTGSNKPTTPAEEALILQMYSNQLANHVSGIYLHDNSTFDQLVSAFQSFETSLDRVEGPADRGCPPGTYQCGVNRCCIFSGDRMNKAGTAEA